MLWCDVFGVVSVLLFYAGLGTLFGVLDMVGRFDL